ncbi:MAG: FecR domain-containing protein [Dysgonamonadaceae bacterium]|nr:FecR domain-containing protein [Dysgonamonadaceae bacterium]
MTKQYTHYTDFLKDRQFVQWQLIPDMESDSYWSDFIQDNPHCVELINEAVDFLKTSINKSQLNSVEIEQLLARIETSIQQNKQKLKIRRLVRYTATACASIALIFGLTFYFVNDQSHSLHQGSELIVGELLNNENIQLITGTGATTFQNNIEIEIDENGQARITQENEETKTLNIAQTVLNKLVVPYGKRTQLTLADGSRVWLNSGTVLEFPTQFTDDNREIFLTQGEMFIEVAHDNQKTFYVHTSEFRVQVYGTAFNVSSYADSPQSVVLVSGSVALQSSVGIELNLLPGEQALLADNGTFSTEKVDVNQFISWKNGFLLFDRTPMTEVLRQIARFYNLSFDYENATNLHTRTCTGRIVLSDNLDDVMTTIALLSSTNIRKENNQIFITNNNN